MNNPGRFQLLFVLISAFLCPMFGRAAEMQALPGHVPAAVARLQPVGRVPAAHRLRLAIGLPLRNRDALTNLLQRIYDPASPDYHQYLTPEQFAEKFGPAREDYQALTDFVKAHGLKVTATHPNRALLDVSGSVAEIEKLLRVTLRVYPHPKEARTFFAPDSEPSLDLAVPILHISGLDDFLLPRPMSLKAAPLTGTQHPTPALGSGPGGTYMGNDFRAAYIPVSSLTGVGQSVGLLEFDGYFPSDVIAYRNLAALPNVPLKNVLLDGFNGIPGANNTEVSLDIDMAASMAPGLSAIIVYEGEVTDDILNRMATDNLAKQLSASWLYPIDPATEQIFQQFAAQGQSFFNAAGDNDAYATGVATPADDPNITVVGGTTLSTTGPGGSWVSETVWNWNNGFGTGGGISTTYPIPVWQQGISMTANHGSTTMRNLPDVALTADNVWLIYDNGAVGAFGGTSCATPLWTAFTALVNQQALANGQPTQGFINPAIYALGNSVNYASTFHDITTGNNTSSQSPANFFAVAGYDLCTGWGTPNGTNLINVLAPPDALNISPATGFTASGGVGGPFAAASQIYLLTNTGASSLKWSLGNTAPWLSASPGGGTLIPGGPAAMVTVGLNAAASNQVVGVYTTLLRFTNLTDGLAQSRLCTLDVITPPIITSPPTNHTVLEGATALFTVQAIGGLPLSFQWQQNGTNLTETGNISGSSTSALTITNVSLSNAGSYSVVVSNAASMVTSTPPALLIIVSSGPVITTQPVSQFALVGATVNFTVAALGNAPLSYQWQQNQTNLIDGGGISGSTTRTLSLGPVSATNAGTYTVIVSNSLNVVTSTPAVFGVYALADMELLQNGGFETGDFSFWNPFGNSALNTVGSDVLFTHSGLYGAEMGPVGSLGYISQTVPTTPGGAYLLSFWLDSPDGASPNEFLTGWNGDTLFDQTNLAAFGWSNFQFIVTATAASTTVNLGFQDDTSFLGLDDVSLKPLLNPAGSPVITAQPPSQTFVAAGSTAMISVSATGQQLLFYQWQSNNVPIANATNATLVLPGITTNQAGTYSVIISNNLGNAPSSNAILSVLTGNPVLVTFDDLALTNALVPNGYDSLGWSNFYHLDPATSAPNPSGYIAGTISQPNVAYNGFGTTAFLSNSTPFSFLSAWLTAAWNNNLRLEVKGYASNALVFDNAYYLSATVPALINFNCVGVTNMEFISTGGTPDPFYGDSGFEFVMDNASIIVNSVPPPANDLCSGAIVVSSDPYTNNQSTLGATSTGDPVPTCMSGFANGVWYRYTPPSNGQMEVDTTGSDFPAGVAVYSGACGALTQVACGVNSVSVTGGTTYYILVGAVGNITGHLVFHLSFSSATAGPPLVLSSPTNVSVVAGSAATFNVSAEGAPPLNYFWRRNGTNIAGATVSTYTTNNVQMSDSGAQFSCLVSNALDTATSSTVTLTVTPPGQLVQNGGFETGNFSFWTLSGNPNNNFVTSNVYVHSGQYGTALGEVGALGSLSQMLPTTVGQLYLLSLWLDSPDGQTPNEFSVAWNGTTLFDQVNLPQIAGWTNLQFRVPATTTNTLLLIGFRDDPTFLGLDDITVLALKPILQNVTQAGSNIMFGWSALPGSLYQIQFTTDLTQTNWLPLGANIPATGYIMTTSESISNNAAQFYRVVLLP